LESTACRKPLTLEDFFVVEAMVALDAIDEVSEDILKIIGGTAGNFMLRRMIRCQTL